MMDVMMCALSCDVMDKTQTQHAFSVCATTRDLFHADPSAAMPHAPPRQYIVTITS
jgi:hypothetical protein